MERYSSSTSAALVVNGSFARCRTISDAILPAKRSSPYVLRMRARSPWLYVLRTSAAVMPVVGSIRMSRGASIEYANPRSDSSSCIEETPRSKRIPCTDSCAGEARLGERILDAVVAGVHERDAIGERSEPATGDLERVRITVEGDEPQLRVGPQEVLGMTTETEGRVDHDGSPALRVVHGEGGAQQFVCAVKQNRGVTETIGGRGIFPLVIHHDPSGSCSVVRVKRPKPGFTARTSLVGQLRGECFEVPARNENLALGKCVRVPSDRGLAAFAGTRSRSDDLAERDSCCLRVVLLVRLDVGLPGLRIPDFEEIDRTDHYAVLGETRVTTVICREGDAPLGICVLLVGTCRQSANEGSRLRIASRRGRGLACESGEFFPGDTPRGCDPDPW